MPEDINNPGQAPGQGQAQPGTDAGEGEAGDTPINEEQVRELLQGTPYYDENNIRGSLEKFIQGNKEMQARATKAEQELKRRQRAEQANQQAKQQQQDMARQARKKQEFEEFQKSFFESPQAAYEWLEKHDQRLLGEVKKKIKPLLVQSKVLDSKMKYGDQLTKNEEQIAEIIEQHNLQQSPDPVGTALAILRGNQYGESDSDARKRILQEAEMEKKRRETEMPPETGARPGEQQRGKEIDDIFDAGFEGLPF